MVSDDDVRNAKKVFMKNYIEEHGSVSGFVDEWEWWIDPTIRCLMETKVGKREKRCKAICTSCRRWKVVIK